MFNPTPPLQKMLRRLPLSPKQAGKEYYKGNRVGSMGKIDQYGNFSPDWAKIRTYVFPANGTENAELTPFVASTLTQTRRTPTTGLADIYPKYFSGDDYLRAWKVGGGHDVVQSSVPSTTTSGTSKASGSSTRGARGAANSTAKTSRSSSRTVKMPQRRNLPVPSEEMVKGGSGKA